MEIFTSYYANIKNLPADIVPISIAGRCPEWYHGLEFKVLAPKIGFFMEWKKNHDNNFYISNFYSEVLDKLNPDEIIGKLYVKSGFARNIALICYEKPGDFCHRHLVAKWLQDVGYDVQEFISIN